MYRFNPATLQRIVIKIGSRSIVRPNGVMRLGFLGKIVTTIGQLRKQGVDVALVSSGAIALGAKRLDMIEIPPGLTGKQACSALGQTELMSLYQNFFSTLRLHTAQLLVTHDDLTDKIRKESIHQTLLELFNLLTIPIINENDSVAVDEIEYGDNDRLAAGVAVLLHADLLILLSEVSGIYETDPDTTPGPAIIQLIDQPIAEFIENNRPRFSEENFNKMRRPLEAAAVCRRHGIPSLIAEARGSVLEAALQGEPVGTFIAAGH